MEIKQLDIFDLTKEENEFSKETLKNEVLLAEDYKEEKTILAYEPDDIVKLVFPTEEQDFELYNYLEHYYSHLKDKKGRIVRVMPYKKLQYLIEFDVKHEDKQLIMHHSNLEWIS